jgi:hypothetical protein
MYFTIYTVVHPLMISAPKSTNLKILRPKVTKTLSNLPKKFCGSPLCILISIFRLVERYLIDGYSPQRLSTYALNLFRHRTTINGQKVLIGKTAFEFLWCRGGQLFLTRGPHWKQNWYKFDMDLFDLTFEKKYGLLAVHFLKRSILKDILNVLSI